MRGQVGVSINVVSYLQLPFLLLRNQASSQKSEMKTDLLGSETGYFLFQNSPRGHDSEDMFTDHPFPANLSTLSETQDDFFFLFF